MVEHTTSSGPSKSPTNNQEVSQTHKRPLLQRPLQTCSSKPIPSSSSGRSSIISHPPLPTSRLFPRARLSPQHIVFSGDSAGGNLSLVLLQTLLQLRRENLRIHWNGEERDVPLPAGVAVCSPWGDITHSSPSCDNNRTYDYLPARSVHPTGMEFPPCSIWPTTPARKNLFAEDALLCHPLVSPLIAKSWEGSPPLWIETGQELLTDEDKYIAMKASSQGVKVVFEEYEAMPRWTRWCWRACRRARSALIVGPGL